MVGTFEALVIALVALLPGATYTWAFEQQAGRWGANVSDRVWRFAGVSTVFLALFMPLFLLAYRELVAAGVLRNGQAVSFWWWPVALAYVGLPWTVGRIAGAALRKRRPWVSALTGPAPSPRAWDHLFTTPRLNGWMLLKLNDGGWLAASGVPRTTPVARR
jgi:hypothetical protein